MVSKKSLDPLYRIEANCGAERDRNERRQDTGVETAVLQPRNCLELGDTSLEIAPWKVSVRLSVRLSGLALVRKCGIDSLFSRQ